MTGHPKASSESWGSSPPRTSRPAVANLPPPTPDVALCRSRSLSPRPSAEGPGRRRGQRSRHRSDRVGSGPKGAARGARAGAPSGEERRAGGPRALVGRRRKPRRGIFRTVPPVHTGPGGRPSSPPPPLPAHRPSFSPPAAPASFLAPRLRRGHPPTPPPPLAWRASARPLALAPLPPPPPPPSLAAPPPSRAAFGLCRPPGHRPGPAPRPRRRRRRLSLAPLPSRRSSGPRRRRRPWAQTRGPAGRPRPTALPRSRARGARAAGVGSHPPWPPMARARVGEGEEETRGAGPAQGKSFTGPYSRGRRRVGPIAKEAAGPRRSARRTSRKQAD